jgi:hypothetical protein
MKLHEIRGHFKKYLTAETAEYAEIILNFLSQRSPALRAVGFGLYEPEAGA